MRINALAATLMALAAGFGLLLAACSSDTPEPTAISIDEYFQRIQALHDAQERQSELIGQQLAAQLSGDETNIDEVFQAMEEFLPEFLPQFLVVLNETRDGLVQITPPAVVEGAHADLLAAYDEFVTLLERGLEQLEDGTLPTEVLIALFSDRSANELGQRFSEIADDLAAIADTAGVEGFVGGGALVLSSAATDEPIVVDVNPVDDTPRVVGLTGIVDVDAVVAAVLGFNGDFAPIESLLQYVTTGCTLKLGAGGPPKCWQVPGTAQVEGTEVEIFPTSVCEAEYQPRGANITRMLGELVAPGGVSGAIDSVHAVYQLGATISTEPYWPDGDYAIVFSVRLDDEMWGTRVRIADGEIVRIDFGCGRTPPEQLAVPGATNLLSGPTGTSTGVGPGISVEEAAASRLVGPLLVNGFVVIADGETRLCQTLNESHPPSCGNPSLLLEGFEPDRRTLTEVAGVAWTSDEVQVLGERVGERLIVSDRSRTR